MTIDVRYTHVTWFPDGDVPAGTRLVVRTSTGIPGGFYVFDHPSSLVRTWLRLIGIIQTARRAMLYPRVKRTRHKSVKNPIPSRYPSVPLTK